MGSERRKACPWALLIILCCELLMAALPLKYFVYHDTNRVISKLEENRYQAPYVLLGDSVITGVLDYAQLDEGDYVNLVTNRSYEVVGQYFLVKRYLEKNPPPKAFIFVAISPFWTNLASSQTRAYITRVFYSFEEIVDLARTKRDARMTTDMIINWLLPTYRHRPALQSKYFKFDMFDPILLKVAADPEGATRPEIGSNLSEVYFERLLGLLRDRGIELYFLRSARPDLGGLELDPLDVQKGTTANYLSSLAARFPNFHFDLDTPFVYPEKLFILDHAHLHTFEGKARFYQGLSAYLQSHFGKTLPPNDFIQ